MDKVVNVKEPLLQSQRRKLQDEDILMEGNVKEMMDGYDDGSVNWSVQEWVLITRDTDLEDGHLLSIGEDIFNEVSFALNFGKLISICSGEYFSNEISMNLEIFL